MVNKMLTATTTEQPCCSGGASAAHEVLSVWDGNREPQRPQDDRSGRQIPDGRFDPFAHGDKSSIERRSSHGVSVINLRGITSAITPPCAPATAMLLLLLDVRATPENPLLTTAAALYEAIGLSPAGVTRALNRLKAAGLVSVVRRRRLGTSVCLTAPALRRFLCMRQMNEAAAGFPTAASPATPLHQEAI